jgi:hypothetical protein
MEQELTINKLTVMSKSVKNCSRHRDIKVLFFKQNTTDLFFNLNAYISVRYANQIFSMFLFSHYRLHCM